MSSRHVGFAFSLIACAILFGGSLTTADPSGELAVAYGLVSQDKTGLDRSWLKDHSLKPPTISRAEDR